MRKIIIAAATAMLTVGVISVIPVVPVHAESSVVAGKMLYSADNKRIGAIYQVDANGAVEILIDDHVLTIDATKLSVKDGKVVTTLTRQQAMSS
ncbi:MAG: hypothetical protein KGQ42_03070 [Alphaproteobacteria bacterium]|nr:hypothetical protein [Alphaproteobacteria bacterium]MDE2042762.1 hypothetical protein [Alphaproteobacteria bacterium]MDE2340003.1 hypothetical protein [Alphaproteobacteria bacterium]